MGLVQGELEGAGIATTGITLLPEITARIRPPRALAVPFPLGYPLGEPNDPAGQRRILRAALELTAREDVPVLAELDQA